MEVSLASLLVLLTVVCACAIVWHDVTMVIMQLWLPRNVHDGMHTYDTKHRSE